MHVHGMGSAADLAQRVKPAIDLIDQAAKKAQGSTFSAPAQSSASLDGAALAKTIGTQGERTRAAVDLLGKTPATRQ